MQRVLVSNIMMLNERERFEREIRSLGYEPVWAEVGQFLNEEECLALVGQIDGWLAGDDAITRKVLESALPRLKVIAKWGTGIDSIDLQGARELGVPVLNSPGAFADAVAEVALGYMLSLSRHIGAVDRAVRAGEWPKPRGRELAGSSLGMVGFGAIGRRIGELGAAFGMKVRFSDPKVRESVDLGRSVAEPTDLQDLAEGADILCVACSLNDDSSHLIDATILAKLRPTAYVVNVGRGPIIDEAALIEALRAGRIAGAGLDVYEEEPLEPGNPLRDLSNVVLGSHNANNGIGAVESVHANTLRNLASHLG